MSKKIKKLKLSRPWLVTGVIAVVAASVLIPLLVPPNVQESIQDFFNMSGDTYTYSFEAGDDYSHVVDGFPNPYSLFDTTLFTSGERSLLLDPAQYIGSPAIAANRVTISGFSFNVTLFKSLSIDMYLMPDATVTINLIGNKELSYAGGAIRTSNIFYMRMGGGSITFSQDGTGLITSQVDAGNYNPGEWNHVIIRHAEGATSMEVLVNGAIACTPGFNMNAVNQDVNVTAILANSAFQAVAGVDLSVRLDSVKLAAF